jgi:hypothetical protein
MDVSELCGWIGSACMLFGTWLIAKKRSEGFLINFASEGLWITRGTLSGLPDIVFVSLAFAVINFYGWYSWRKQGVG